VSEVEQPPLESPTERCSSCNAPLRPGAAFCGSCGAAREAQPSAGSERSRPRRLLRSLLSPGGLALLSVVLVIAAGGFALNSERSARRDSVSDLQGELDNTRNSLTIAQAQNATLAKRLKGVEGTVARSRKGLRPLAQQALKSVYTVEAGEGGGTAWLAWKSGGQNYLVTANHVVAGPGEQVTLRQHSRTWPGTVIRTDETNDLALIRTSAELGPALWQEPQLEVTPVAGDQLVLVGSPYGLEGTVTEGVVSRVTYDAIQTDAAANPGNSGGPALDKDGNVVGVLLAGGGENINFAVPIQRACVELRPCKS
jgi:S1-C subfamily serine protease